jgi:hypothetical protein
MSRWRTVNYDTAAEVRSARAAYALGWMRVSVESARRYLANGNGMRAMECIEEALQADERALAYAPDPAPEVAPVAVAALMDEEERCVRREA